MVKQGQRLVLLDTFELRDRQLDALKRMDEAQKEEEKYLNTPGKISDANIARARRDAARAEADLYESQIKSSEIVAPHDGMILKGDLSEKIGQKVQLGEDLFSLAANANLRLDLTVPERDIQDVKVGASGKLATDALPMYHYPFKVTRVIPLGEAKEGANSFTVYGDVDPAAMTSNPNWRPGMAGEARVDVGYRSLAWIWTHRLIDFLRLKLWM